MFYNKSMDNDQINQLKLLIKQARKIVFFGGAGVSTESGISDFRSKDGLYNLESKYNAPYEVMLSRSYFDENTETFFKFYREFMVGNKPHEPNEAHKYLVKLEKKKHLTIITQNIDGLHQLAGSKNVIELHGSIQRNYCMKCGAFYDLNEIMKTQGIPYCPKCGGIIKPDVVLYEEPLDKNIMTKATIALQEADLLIVAGTSLNVYPAAGLLQYFYGNNIVVINKDRIPINRQVKLVMNDKIGEVFSKLD